MDREEIEQLAETVQQEGEGLSPAASAEPAPSQPQGSSQAPPPRSGDPLLAALHAARQQNRELRERMDALERANAPKGPARPDPKVDPVGYLAWLETREGQQEKERQEREESDRQSARDRETQQEVMNAYLEAVDEFQGQTPDFGEAYQFLVKWGHDQLRAAIPQDPRLRNPMFRAQQQAMYEFQFVQGAMANGVNPAAAVYQKAIELGWQSDGTGAATAVPNPAPAAVGAAPARDPATGQFVTQQAQQLTPPPRSLSQARGGAPAALTPESVAGMSGEELDKRMKADPDFWRKLHGAR